MLLYHDRYGKVRVYTDKSHFQESLPARVAGAGSLHENLTLESVEMSSENAGTAIVRQKIDADRRARLGLEQRRAPL